MTPASGIQRELEALLETRARLAAAGAATEDVSARIAILAAALGLDPDELDGVDLSPDSTPLVGDLVVRRRFGELIYLPMVLVLAAIVVGLGQPAIGIGVGGTAIVALPSSAHDASPGSGSRGRAALSLPGRIDQLEWSNVTRLEFAYRYPNLSSKLDRAAGTTVHLQFHLRDGRITTLARGRWPACDPPVPSSTSSSNAGS